MKTIAFKITIHDDYREALIADLAEMDFRGFEELEEEIIAYIGLQQLSDVNREYIEILLQQLPGDNYIISEEEIEDKNWNETWENTIQPTRAGPFWIQPTWNRDNPPENLIPLLIDPKMAFGTGYHETTRLMLGALPDIIEGGENLLDVGTGTGILAIAAVKLGIAGAKGLDIDAWSYQNATENIYLNDVAEKIEIIQGSLDKLNSTDSFDVITANINRNTISQLADSFLQHLKPEGRILLSGLLKKDENYVRELPAFTDLRITSCWQENEWIALLLQ